MSQSSESPTRKRADGSVFIGILLLALGLLFLFDKLNVMEVGSIWSFWPFILVVIGIQKLTTGDTLDKVGSGLWMIFIGLWLYVSIEHLWGIGFSESWPALLIAWGIGMIWRSFGRPWPFLRKESVS